MRLRIRGVEFFAYPIAGLVFLAIARILWTYGKDRAGLTRPRAWLGCSVLGTFAALLLSVSLAFVAAMTANHRSGDGSWAVIASFSPLLIALLVVTVSARGRAGTLPGRPRMFQLLAIALFAVALIVLSYFILSS